MSSFLSRASNILMNEILTSPSSTVQEYGSKTFNSNNREVSPTVAAAMTATYTAAIKTREEYNREYEQIKNYYLLDALIINIAEDALTPDVSSGDILRIHSDNKDIQSELDKLQAKFNLDIIVSDIMYDLLAYGEYPLRLEAETGVGLVGIHDDVELNSVISFYKQGLPYNFMVRETINRQIKISVKGPADYAHFMLSGRKIRINAFNTLNNQASTLPQEVQKLPSHVRVGRPILYGVITKFKELDLLEKLVPASKLADLASGSIIGVEVPPSTDPKEAFNIAREYENLFNKKVSVDTATGNMSAVDILTQAGKTKVIPTFNGKGGMQNVDVRGTQVSSEMMASIHDTRDIICTSIGFPTELLFGGASKTETIKKYARYLRKIKAIQSCISNGVMQIALTHLKNIDSTKNVKVSDIRIEFRNESVNVDELEKLEYHDTVSSYIGNVIDLLQKMKDGGYDSGINRDDITNWISDKLEYINYEVDAEHQGAAQNQSKLKDRPKLKGVS
jgi:hypothetical protein